MLRVFAIAAVLAAFGAALYFSGNYLQTWESPEPPANAAPAPPANKKKRAGKRGHRARPTKKLAGREDDTAWLTELNAFCIRTLDEMEAIEPPSGPQEVPRYLRQVERTNTRLNRQMIALVQRSRDTKRTKALRRLFDQEQRLTHTLLEAAQNGDAQGLRRAMHSVLAVAKAENRLLLKLGSVDCTLEPDAFDLPY